SDGKADSTQGQGLRLKKLGQIGTKGVHHLTAGLWDGSRIVRDRSRIYRKRLGISAKCIGLLCAKATGFLHLVTAEAVGSLDLLSAKASGFLNGGGGAALDFSGCGSDVFAEPCTSTPDHRACRFGCLTCAIQQPIDARAPRHRRSAAAEHPENTHANECSRDRILARGLA